MDDGNKWGIGSGVGRAFIIAGISEEAIINGFINWAPVNDMYPVGFTPSVRGSP